MDFQRVFLAIKLPELFISQIVQYQERLDPSIFRVEKREQLHLTLIFLGSLSDQDIHCVQTITSNLTKNFQPQPLKFTNITYGPSAQNPRLIWLQGEPNKNLEQLKQNLETELRNKINFKKENRPFLPHITLARIKINALNHLPPSSKISTPLSFDFIPQSLWLIESQLQVTGAQYTDLEEFPFHLS
jgi:2'-5' RNA ligase